MCWRFQIPLKIYEKSLKILFLHGRKKRKKLIFSAVGCFPVLVFIVIE